ncbi:heterogeneous nuclear ribonucleoprotein K-like isoform X1 [Vespula squamosa]|uniref:Heterogeneous nuclear ribonucleoprotein K-like isoform X1 n=1 Tax=Vespula squamosa TaxID=30214 RepID=A0ABD2BS45_VESSQ
MTGSGGPTSPHKRYRQGDDELRLLIPSKQVQRRESKRRITRKGEVSRGESETQLVRIGRVRDAMSMLYTYACMETICTG